MCGRTYLTSGSVHELPDRLRAVSLFVLLQLALSPTLQSRPSIVAYPNRIVKGAGERGLFSPVGLFSPTTGIEDLGRTSIGFQRLAVLPRSPY